MKRRVIYILAAALLILCGCKAAVETEELWLLESQKAYTPDGQMTLEVQYQYDEDGYKIYRGMTYYKNGESSWESNDTYEYTGEETEDGKRVAIQTVDYGDSPGAQAGTIEPRRVTMTRDARAHVWTSTKDICTAVYFPEDMDEGNILYTWNERTDNQPQFHHAEYTFDEHGNPTHVVTYSSDMTVIGTAEFTWRLCEVVKDE